MTFDLAGDFHGDPAAVGGAKVPKVTPHSLLVPHNSAR